MPSRAGRQQSLPGPPTLEELAYLAGLVDANGTFVASPALKVTVSPPISRWLLARFCGTVAADGRWWLARQADLSYVLPRLAPLLVAKQEECRALAVLVEHLRLRATYAGGADWSDESLRLRGAVRAAAAARMAQTRRSPSPP